MTSKYEIILEGFNGGTDETDDRVVWVETSGDVKEIEAFLNESGVKNFSIVVLPAVNPADFRFPEQKDAMLSRIRLVLQPKTITMSVVDLLKTAEPQRRVVCAANKYVSHFDGKVIIIAGARHYDTVMRSQIEALDKSYWHLIKHTEVQGFIDQRGEFMTREEAWQVAFRAGQIVRRCGGDGSRLFSENLY